MKLHRRRGAVLLTATAAAILAACGSGGSESDSDTPGDGDGDMMNGDGDGDMMNGDGDGDGDGDMTGSGGNGAGGNTGTGAMGGMGGSGAGGSAAGGSETGGSDGSGGTDPGPDPIPPAQSAGEVCPLPMTAYSTGEWSANTYPSGDYSVFEAHYNGEGPGATPLLEGTAAPDRLHVTTSNAFSLNQPCVFGGAGDDILEVELSSNEGNSVATLGGGEGADVFAIRLPFQDENHPFHITDFEPGVDKLALDLWGINRYFETLPVLVREYDASQDGELPESALVAVIDPTDGEVWVAYNGEGSWLLGEIDFAGTGTISADDVEIFNTAFGCNKTPQVSRDDNRSSAPNVPATPLTPSNAQHIGNNQVVLLQPGGGSIRTDSGSINSCYIGASGDDTFQFFNNTESANASTAIGGKGADTFVFSMPTYSQDRVKIMGFTPGEDRLVFDEELYFLSSAEQIMLSATDVNAGSTEVTSFNGIVYDQTDGELYYTNGEGTVLQFGELDGAPDISATDISWEMRPPV